MGDQTVTDDHADQEPRAAGSDDTADVNDERPTGDETEASDRDSRRDTFAELPGAIGEFVENALRGVAPLTAGRRPRYDLIEAESGYAVEMDLPGIAKESLRVRTQGEVLIVSGERTRPELPQGGRLHRAERTFGVFERRIDLPAAADGERIRARLEQGILEIQIERRAPDAPRDVPVD